MISTNRIFESAHGPEIPNLLEIVAGLYSIGYGLPRSKNHEIRKRETDFNIIYAFNSTRR
jgi:hypothetical protein